MDNYSLTKNDVEKELNSLEIRLKKADELNLLNDKKYESSIKEMRLRVNALTLGLNVVDSIKDYEGDCDKLLEYVTKFYSSIFNLKAGHRDENKKLTTIYGQIDNLSSETLKQYNYYFDKFNSKYDYSNTDTLNADVTGYVTSVLLLFLTIRDRIKLIKRKG